MKLRAPLLSLALLLAACKSAPPENEEMAADRGDVANALYAQFDQVLRRRVEIHGDDSEAATKEREELDRLADEIAVRIVRVDPHADVDELVRRLEESR